MGEGQDQHQPEVAIRDRHCPFDVILIKVDGEAASVEAQYSGGMDKVREELAKKEEGVLFAFVRYFLKEEKGSIDAEAVGRVKMIFITYVAPHTQAGEKAAVANKKAIAQNWVKNFHVEFYATSLDDISDEVVFDRVKNATGAFYDHGGKGADQTTEGVATHKESFSKPKGPGGRGRGARRVSRKADTNTP
eukprot:CAMPEP_0113879378 /NCGR_PEP_ID=MMETSP0780_2-20120614/7209_1 /TAXON_ID=652834 /ORGANISM="Palpitomonas bilix" /LENGTH=190 /DNA_ID=CAMNT_0000865961 /DNA_START=96 /DNA_END=669 /DNA_ORIENTATION=- /assembly_acc=CAM_ASM_000599